MAVTAQDVVTRARSLMQDELVPYRYSDAAIVNAINDGVQEMLRLRPDLFIASQFSPVVVVLLTDVVPIGDRYITAMVFFTVGYLMLREDEYANDARAGQLIAAAQSYMGMPPGSQG